MIGSTGARNTDAARRSLPLSITLPCWYNFRTRVQFEGRTLQSASNWDALRQSGEAGFAIPQARTEWEVLAERNINLRARAEAIERLIRVWGTRQVVSVGVGTGMLEYVLKLRAPDVAIRCGEYAPATVQLLQNHFGDRADVRQMDLRESSWAEPGDLVLLNRVDMELSDKEWRRSFSLLAHGGVTRIIFVPCGLMSPFSLVRQARILTAGVLRRQALTRTGWMRTPRRLISLFSAQYRLSQSIPRDGFEVWGLEAYNES